MKKNVQDSYPVAMTVAGSDSGGGAGIQADLRTFNAFGVFGCSAVTALTSQNPAEVRRIDGVPPEGVAAQIAAVLDKIEVRAVKTGMLFNADIVRAVAAELKKRQRKLPLVVDPVMVAGSGARLLEESAVRAVVEELLPLADYLTPNIPEAELLLGRRLAGEAAYLEAARECARRFGCRCYFKTGHAPPTGSSAADILAFPDGAAYRVSTPRLEGDAAGHGTGCTLSAALAAGLALDFAWKTAVCCAKAFVYGSLAETVRIGSGLEAMYPPEENYNHLVKLEAL